MRVEKLLELLAVWDLHSYLRLGIEAVEDWATLLSGADADYLNWVILSNLLDMALFHFLSGCWRGLPLLLSLAWVVLVIRTFDMLLSPKITISAARLMLVFTSATPWRTSIEIIAGSWSAAYLRVECSFTGSASCHASSGVHPASASTVVVSHHGSPTESLVLTIVAILIRLLIMEVCIVVATSKSATPSRVIRASVIIFTKLSLLNLLIWISEASTHCGSSSGAMIKH